jgi:hypothetical protein
MCETLDIAIKALQSLCKKQTIPAIKAPKRLKASVN